MLNKSLIASLFLFCLPLATAGGCLVPDSTTIENGPRMADAGFGSGAGGTMNGGGAPGMGGTNGDNGISTTGGTRVLVTIDAEPVRHLDILFMIDNSGSMKQEQENLQKNFPKFIEVLRKLPGGMPDLHIGVVSSNVGAGNVVIDGNPPCNRPGGDRGQFNPPIDIGLEDGNKFIIVEKNGTKDNIFGDKTVESTFAMWANLGVKGCGYEHQLQSVRLALHENVTPHNAGFLRRDANLAIIMLTDEDDCSAPLATNFFVDDAFPNTEQQASLRCALVGHRCNGILPPAEPFMTPLSNCVADENGGGKLIPVKEIVQDIRQLKPDRDRIIVSAIMGWPRDPKKTQYGFSRDLDNLLDFEPVCSSSNGSAATGLRLHQFVKAFDGSVESICQDDFGPALQKIATQIALKSTPGCIPGLLVDADFDAKNNRFAPDCGAQMVVHNNTSGLNEAVSIQNRCNNAMAPDASTNKPCLAILRDPVCADASGSGGWRARIVRDGAPVPGSWDNVSCRVCSGEADAPEALAGLCH